MANGGAQISATFCKRGRVVTRNEELTFHQWTYRGYIRCQVTIPIGVCDQCEAKTWDEAVDAIIEEAGSEQDKLR